jgi:hypothetical protein
LSSSDEWKDFQVEQANSLHTQLTPAQRQKWNDRVREVDAFWKQVSEPGLKRAVRSRRLPMELGQQVAWDILHAGMECEYADVIRPGFFSGLLQLYREGRFPCGWGVVNASGEIELSAMEPDLDPADPDYFLKLVNWPIYSTFFREIRLPAGQLVVF